MNTTPNNLTFQNMVQNLTKHGANRIAKSVRNTDNKIITKSYGELQQNIEHASYGFLSLGLEKGDRAFILSDNDWEWMTASLGLNNAGIIDVPRGNDTRDDELAYLLDHSGAKVAIAQTQHGAERLGQLKPNLEEIITLRDIPGTMSMNDIMARGEKERLTNNLPLVEPENLSSIIYTSGSTGTPKGVMLSHKNYISNFTLIPEIISLTPEDRWLSILPVWHVFERAAEYGSLWNGNETRHSNIKNLAEDLQDFKPTVMGSVPRLWESFYDKLMTSVDRKLQNSSALKRALFNIMFPSIVPSTIKQGLQDKLGGQLRYAISGGSAMPVFLEEFYKKANVPIVQGYGMTEGSPLFSAQRPGKQEQGTVGIPISNVEIRIADYETDAIRSPNEIGEIQVRGPNIMQGYWNEPELTAKTFTANGWLKTGDLGTYTKKGNLKITGRAKSTIVLRNGENVEPEPLEQALSQSKYINDQVIVGQDEKQLGALLTPNLENLVVYCSQHKIPFDKERLSDTLSRPEIQKLFGEEIQTYVNKKVGQSEKIGHFKILDKVFEIGQELTATYKVRRNQIAEMYHAEIDRLFGSSK